MLNWTLILAILLPNIGGWAGALTMAGQVKRPDGKAWYQLLKKPSWNPPDWVFGPAWTALYCAMGYASYLVYEKAGGFTDDSVIPLALYGTQLILNWTWTPIFFRFHLIGLAFIEGTALYGNVLLCTLAFFTITPRAAYLMIPYIAWLTFAGCLNYTIWQLNKNNPTINSFKYSAD